MYIFKEKLKKLNFDIESWNKEIFGNVNQLGEELQRKIQDLDVRDDEDELGEEGKE